MVEGARSRAKELVKRILSVDSESSKEQLVRYVIQQGQQLGLKLELNRNAVMLTIPTQGEEQRQLALKLQSEALFSTFMASLYYLYQRCKLNKDFDSAQAVLNILGELSSIIAHVQPHDRIQFSADAQDSITGALSIPDHHEQNQVVLAYYLTPSQKMNLDQL